MRTPDFATYPLRVIKDLKVHPLGLEVRYDDNRKSFHLAVDLREHSVDIETTHPITRETLISPLDVPENFSIKEANILENGHVSVTWSHSITPEDKGCSNFHSGWLYQTALSDDIEFGVNLETKTWDTDGFDDIPKCDGSTILDDEKEFLDFLIYLIRYGIVVIRNLPIGKEILEEFASKIGTIRSSNFGRIFDVKTRKDPDSNAYTNEELLVHNDLSTREYVPGMQLLYCIENETDGGLSTLTDGFAVAENFKQKQPETYKILSDNPVNFASKGESSDYRIKAPLFQHNETGDLIEVRWTCWLRAPLRGELKEMDKLYKAQKDFYRLANDPKYKVEFKLMPGDMMCMDNRRVLHGRTGFTENSGDRWIRGCYMERDELWSALRVALRTQY